MKKIQVKTENDFLYIGTFDLNKNELVSFYTNEKVEFEIKEVIGDFKINGAEFNLIDLKQICKDANIKAVFYPNGNISFRKLDTVNDELKTCYVSKISTEKTDYIVCVAFDETQPMLYKAKLVSVYTMRDKK